MHCKCQKYQITKPKLESRKNKDRGTTTVRANQTNKETEKNAFLVKKDVNF